jgi:endonuclease G, mitochondrial
MRPLSTTVRTVWHQHGSLLIFASSIVVVAANGVTTPTIPTTTTTSSCESSSSSRSSFLSRAAPISPIYTYRPNPFLEIAYDVRTKCPVYVLEQLQPEHLVSAGNDGPRQRRRRRPNFYEEKSLPENFRSRMSHTRQQSNWDRGHMAPAGDFSYEDALLKDTFCLTNTAPQDAALNRGPWAALEEWTRQVAVRAWKEHSSRTKTFVLTGPLWLPTRQTDAKEFEFQYLALGTPPSLLSIPSHFFKVVVIVLEEESSSSKDSDIVAPTTTLGAACFVLPNQPIPPVSDFKQYSVPFKALEAVSGLTLFPAFLTNEQKDVIDETLPRHLQGEPTQLLLLPDGSATSTPRKNRSNPKRSITMVRHLCEKGACNVSSRHSVITNARD